jgi:uncharacterized surface protein with fasciclin (FAS1) repeats
MKKWLILMAIVLSVSVLAAQNISRSSMIPSNDIIANLSHAKEFSVLLSAIDAAGLTETFKSAGSLTFFAPTNQAFEKLPKRLLDTLLKPNHKTELSYLLSSLVIPGRLTVKDIIAKLKANNGTAIFITSAGSKLVARININRNLILTDENGGEGVVSKFDISQSNGVMQIINSVLIPKSKGL